MKTKNITFTVTEEDAAKAGVYSDNCNCIIGTGLQRLGYKDAFVYPATVRVNRGEYDIDSATYNRISRSLHAATYPKSLVGMRVTLKPRKF